MRDDPIVITRGSSGPGLGTAVVGLVLLFYGVAALLFAGDSLETDAIGGTVEGERWLGGIEGNGWTNLSILAGGLLLILSSPVDPLARVTALLVGVAFGGAALVAVVDGDDVLGFAATNRRTALAFAVVGMILVLIGLARPRRGDAKRRRRDLDARREDTSRAAEAPRPPRTPAASS